MARPSGRFSSDSTRPWPPDLARRLTLRNSSQSARTRFMCCEVVSGCESGELEKFVAYLVECKHLTHELASVIHGGSHAPVDLLFNISMCFPREILEAALTQPICSLCQRTVSVNARVSELIERGIDSPSCPAFGIGSHLERSYCRCGMPKHLFFSTLACWAFWRSRARVDVRVRGGERLQEKDGCPDRN